MSSTFTESVVEEATLDWLRELGYGVIHGQEIAPDAPRAERANFGEVVLEGRLRSALARINPGIPEEAREDALRQVLHIATPGLVESNRRFHALLTGGVPIEYQRADGAKVGDRCWLVDFTDPDRNDWLAVNQFTIIEGRANRRPDVVLFVNGLPLAVLELKNAADADATIAGAYNQFQTYKRDIPSLFVYNEALVVSDGLEARLGSLTSDFERFMPWRTVEGDHIAPRGTPEIETLLKGVFERRRFLDLIHHFVVFEVEGPKIAKKIAAYHQYHAVNKAVTSTLRAASPAGDRRVGVIWHTQGSGKSLSMVFYAGTLIAQPEMENPTLVVLTDRNDLDDQLFGTFSACRDILRQTPAQATDRENLRELLRVAAGGVVFTTIQKFLPSAGVSALPAREGPGVRLRVAEGPGARYNTAQLTNRRNVVVIADEAHRSQYDFIDGFARHLRDALPNASFIGFTGTPVEQSDRSTPAVFGDYIDVYDIQRSVEDGATVRIYYEGRLARLALDESERPRIDPEFEEVTEGEESAAKEKLKSKWARLEAMVGAEKRIGQIAEDIVAHWERRAEALDGKGMIVCMSRRIAVDLYNAIVTLRPEWHSDDDKAGAIKVVMTGSATDPLPMQPHIRNKARREALALRFKNPADPLRLVIVRDMWLTGFDAPCLHTMYADKPMRGHGLMQAIARVNRVFKDKPGGLVVDYLGLADQLKRALQDYTEGDRSEAGIPQEVAVAIMREKYEIVAAMFRDFDYSPFFVGAPRERLGVIPAAMEHILTLREGKTRFLVAVLELSKAFALAVPADEALAIRDHVGFFQTLRAAFVKVTPTEGKTRDELESAIRQLVSRAVASDEVIDIFAAAGLKSPDISILSDAFLAEVKGLPQKNLALETLRKLLNGEIAVRARKNLIESRSFSARLQEAILKYQNRAIDTAEAIQQLIDLARDMREAHRRGEDLGLSEDELAFYDALEVNDSAVKVLGDETLRTIARDLVRLMRENVTVDWTVRETARAHLRVLVKRLLRRCGYPPNKQEKAIQTVIEQAELICKDWAAA